jgi:drug/metabolite transporter (DMT)-like permease
MRAAMTLAAPTTPARSNIALGIFFMCAAGTVFPIMNGTVQLLSPRYPSEQIVWSRTASHLIFVLALFAPKFGIMRLVTTVEPKWQFLRSFALLISTICFFTGVKSLALAKAASISFVAPFIVALLAWPMLRERISVPRMLAVVTAFCGVLIVIRPGSDVFQWASLYILGSATSYAFYQVFTRKVAGRDLPETSAVYSALLGTAVLGVLMPWIWTPVQSLYDGALLIALGILGGLGHYFVARAMTYAAASVIAPFQYFQMIGSVAVGYLFMGNLPDNSTWLGAAIIISAGLYIGWRETREKKAATASPT